MAQLFVNYYKHCDTEWSDVWNSTCNDKCPICNCEIEPYKSIDIPKFEEDDFDNKRNRYSKVRKKQFISPEGF